MRLPLLVFFAFGAPFALFLATILYGGHTRDTIKQALIDSPVYTQISEHFAKEDALVISQKDYPYYVSKRFTPDYFRQKTESVLDASAAWIIGRSEKIPVVAFNELKNDMQKDHPELLTALEEIPTEKELARSGMDQAQRAQYLDQAKQLKKFSEKDFAVPLAHYLQSVKTTYNGLKIALPIYIFILLCALVMIGMLSQGTPAKFKWVGASLLMSSIVGYTFVFFYAFNKDTLTHFNVADQTEFITLVTPIIVTALNHFTALYATNQIIMSTLLLIIAVMCFLGAFFTRHQTTPSVKPLKVKPSFWKETPKKK